MYVLLFFVFFFQAEDGIRDGHVTGVQTCALPIFAALLGASPGASVSVDVMLDVMSRCFDDFPEWEDKIKEMIPSFGISLRSEERRVGKECRSWWWAYRWKKKERERVRSGVYGVQA